MDMFFVCLSNSNQCVFGSLNISYSIINVMVVLSSSEGVAKPSCKSLEITYRLSSKLRWQNILAVDAKGLRVKRICYVILVFVIFLGFGCRVQ